MKTQRHEGIATSPPMANPTECTVLIKGLTLDLPGRDEAFGRRIASLLEQSFARMEIHSSSPPGESRRGPVELRLGLDASEGEIVRGVVDAVARSVQGPGATQQSVAHAPAERSSLSPTTRAGEPHRVEASRPRSG